MAMTEVSCKEMHICRMATAVGWSILFQFLFLYAYVFIANLDMWHPFSVFGNSFSSIFSTKTIINVFPLALVIFCQGILCSRDYIRQSKSQLCITRFAVIMNMFSIHNIVALGLHLVVGLTVGCIYTSVSKESINSIFVPCSSEIVGFEKNCLNEKKFFLVVAGIWIGFYTFMKDYIFQTKYLIFPPVQQEKFIRVKSSFFPCVKGSLIKAIYPTIMFFILYYFKGEYVRTQFSTLTSLSIQGSGLDTIFTVIDLELMFYLWILQATFLITLDIMVILFNIHLTERAIFPITTFMAPPGNHIPLNEALCEKIPIIQHLGFFDLALLSEFQTERRAELFTLSQPGGHAHIWNAIISQCFQIIHNFTDELDKAFDDPNDVSFKSQMKKHDSISQQSFVQHAYSHRMRSLSPDDYKGAQAPINSVPLQQTYKNIVKLFNQWVNAKLQAFYKKPVISYFFGNMIEPKLKQLLFQSQPVIWAVRSISVLACSSIKEDHFGVVQNDLPSIITTLLHLRQSLEKLQKQNIYVKKSNKQEMFDVQMKNTLRFTVKQSLYRISVAFNVHIKDINLPPDVQQQMSNFIAFKEV